MEFITWFSTEDTNAKLLKQLEELMGRMKHMEDRLEQQSKAISDSMKVFPIRKALLIIILTIPEAVAEGMVRVIIKEVITENTKVVTLKIVLVTIIHREVIETVAPREVIVVAPTAVVLTSVTAPVEPTIL